MNDTSPPQISRSEQAKRWWQDLQDYRDGKPNPRADRASRARLRRADAVAAVAEEAVMALYRRLGGEDGSGFDHGRLKSALRLALVLVHVRQDEAADQHGDRKSFARQIGRESFGDKAESARLHPLRFQRLLAARSDEEIIQEFRRAVDIAGNKANVRDLAGLLLHWDLEETRTRFAFDYYAAGIAAPKVDAEPALSA
jgi:CRISPR system Cascade subunit CasB